MTDLDLLNRLTTVAWLSAAELARQVAAYRRRAVAVDAVDQRLRALEEAGAVERQPRELANGGYCGAEYRLTERGAQQRLPGRLWSPHVVPETQQADDAP